MPGPVSDSYHPEYSTQQNAFDIVEAINEVRKKISFAIGSDELKYIVNVVHGKHGKLHGVTLTEKELRIIRFCMDQAKEGI